jgi:hypothetical protein
MGKVCSHENGVDAIREGATEARNLINLLVYHHDAGVYVETYGKSSSLISDSKDTPVGFGEFFLKSTLKSGLQFLRAILTEDAVRHDQTGHSSEAVDRGQP